MGIQYRKDICTCHGEERFIVKRLSGDMFCNEGNQDRLKEKNGEKIVKPLKRTPLKRSTKPLKRSPIKYKRKVTGELVLFQAIWNTRKHVSWISGTELGEDLNVMCMFHVLGKGAYPGYRLLDKNIILTTTQEHWDWHNKGRSDLLKQDSRWQKVFDLELELKRAYHA